MIDPASASDGGDGTPRVIDHIPEENLILRRFIKRNGLLNNPWPEVWAEEAGRYEIDPPAESGARARRGGRRKARRWRG